MKGIIGTVANGKAGLGLHSQCWWSKESMLNRRKIGLEEIDHLVEVRLFATAVGQRKQGAWTKWDSAKDGAVPWSDLRHMEPKKLNVLIKAVYDAIPTPANLHARGLNTPDRCKAYGKTEASNIFSLDVSTLKEAILGYIAKSWRFVLRFQKYVERLSIKL